MQQLTLQFEGFAQVQQPVDAAAAKQRTSVTKAWYEVYQALVVALLQCGNLVRTWCKEHQEELEVYVGGTVLTFTCFALMIIAAVLQGGAQ